mgnify:CR=1 FL=1
MEGRRPVGRPKMTWSKVVEEDMRKLNITEDMAEDRKQWRQLISRPTPGEGKLGTVNEEDDNDDVCCNNKFNFVLYLLKFTISLLCNLSYTLLC